MRWQHSRSTWLVAGVILIALTSTWVRGEEAPDPGSCIAKEIKADLEEAGPYWGLGAYAFFDKNLSRDRSVACADCHDPRYSYTNPTPLRDVESGLAKRRAPSLLNLRDQRWLFWDGRASSLETAVLHPLYGQNELNLDRETMVERAREDEKYRLLLDAGERDKWFGKPERTDDPDQVIERALAKSLASYLKTLVSCGTSRENIYFAKDLSAGRELFRGKAGCSNCHFGRNFTDGQFHNIRVRPIRNFEEPDSGRYAIVKELNSNGAKLKLTQEMWGSFKTPSLRNVGRRPPYMHQGQFDTLGKVVKFYSDFENALPEDHHYAGLLKPLQLSPTEISQLVAYLTSLNDTFYTCVTNTEGGMLLPSSCKFEDN
ncbi:cytochrome c peroxidase [Mesorhizobium sp. M0227]|uniref:cytochrome-c peroxidase n=1 Tax=Mesorhizobium sp. M0227 TaxID=2956922 RepID=UPI00333755CB